MDISTVIDAFKDVTTLTIPKPFTEFLKLDILDDASKTPPSQHLQSTCSQPFGVTPVFEAPVRGLELLASGDDVKSVYGVTLSLLQPVSYSPGDTIGILARNHSKEVDEVLTAFGFQDIFDKPFTVKTTDVKKKVPIFIPSDTVLTIRRVLMECLDLHGVPKKLFIRALMECTSCSSEKRFLEVLCSKEGSNTYSSFIESGSGTFLGLVRLLKTCHPDFSLLMTHLGRLLPRPYSVTTTPKTHKNEIKFVFSFENGLVTTYLQGMPPKIDIYFRQTTKFCYNEEHFSKNLIMIGPGTGIAPFMGFLAYKEVNGVTSDAWLLTGCRYKQRNQLFKEEIENFLKNNVLTKYSQAFSRDLDSNAKYVQDLIRTEQEMFVQWMLKDNTVIYVCGEGKRMLPDIQNTIVEALKNVNFMSENDAVEFVKDLKKSGKYIEDIWI